MNEFVVPNAVSMDMLQKLIDMKSDVKYKAIQKILTRLHKVETEENIEKASRLIDRRIEKGTMTPDSKDVE